jgi:hypothetical protein
LYRVGYHYESFSFWHGVGLGYFVLIYYFAYRHLSGFANPQYDATGDITYPGEDLGGKGLIEYYWDIVYVSWFTQVTSMFSNWFYLTLLAVS